MVLLRFKANTISLSEQGIVIYKAEGDQIYSSDDLRIVIDMCEELTGGVPFLLLMDIGPYKFLMTNDARNFFNHYEKADRLIKAEAILTSSVTTSIMFNLLTKLNAPKFPFRAFSKKENAIAWLKKYE